MNHSEVIVRLFKGPDESPWQGLLKDSQKRANIKLDFARAQDSEDEPPSEEEEEDEELPPRIPSPDPNVEVGVVIIHGEGYYVF